MRLMSVQLQMPFYDLPIQKRLDLTCFGKKQM